MIHVWMHLRKARGRWKRIHKLLTLGTNGARYPVYNPRVDAPSEDTWKAGKVREATSLRDQ
ncbi:hypothetical protein Tco_0788062, partial [Tanacetum coccineum]